MPVPSPCIGHCQLNKAKVCQGCHRSIDEIALWSSMSDAQRQRTIDRIKLMQLSLSIEPDGKPLQPNVITSIDVGVDPMNETTALEFRE